MTRKEYHEFLNYELYGNNSKGLKLNFWVKYFRPNTNFVFLCRKMWYLYSRGTKLSQFRAKLLYLKIYRKYGCNIERKAKVGKGFSVSHPVGMVIGVCEIGNDFRMYQNCTVGIRHTGDEKKGLYPRIGNNVKLYCSSMILGNVTVADNVVIGANSLCNKSITESGVYVGNPVRKIAEAEKESSAVK